MAEEQRGDAARMREIRATSSKQKGRSHHQHDYKRGDDLKLRTREATYEQLATMLDRRRDDQGFVDGIVLHARARAWDDIGTTVVGRLGWAQRPADDYEVGRDERLQQMLDEDFATLLAEHPTGAGSPATTPADADEPDEGTGPRTAPTPRTRTARAPDPPVPARERRVALVVPGVPGPSGRTWSFRSTRHARFHQPSQASWEGTGSRPIGRPAAERSSDRARKHGTLGSGHG